MEPEYNMDGSASPVPPPLPPPIVIQRDAFEIIHGEIVDRALAIAESWASAGLHSTDGTDADNGGEIDKIESYFGMHGEPWCAMFASYCYAKAYAEAKNIATIEDALNAMSENLFPASASCITLMSDAQVNSRWHSIADVQPGDLVLYCWNGRGVAEHVGLFIKHIDGQTFTDVEGNTVRNAEASSADGHGVYVRSRSTTEVLGIVSIR